MHITLHYKNIKKRILYINEHYITNKGYILGCKLKCIEKINIKCFFVNIFFTIFANQDRKF
jgi:hypothetical protein